MKKYPLLFLSLAILLLLYLLLAPPRWYLNMTKQVDVSPEVGAALVEKYGYRGCHVISGSGAFKAPHLDAAAQRESEEALYGWLANPRAIRANTAFQN